MMRQKLENRLLKLTALSAVLISLFCGAQLLRVLIFNDKAWTSNMPAWLAAVITGWLASALSRRIRHWAYKLSAVGISVVIAAGITVACTSSAAPCHSGFTGLRTIFEGIAAVFVLFIAAAAERQSTAKFFSGGIRPASVVPVALSLAAAHFLPAFHPGRHLYIILVYQYTLLYTVAAVFLNLEHVFYQRGIDAPEVQNRIKKAAGIAVGVLFGSILLLSNLKGILSAIINLTLAAGRSVVRFVAWLISLLFRHKESSYVQEFGFMPFDPQPPWTPEVVLAISIFCWFTVLYAAYRLLPRLPSLIIKAIKHILRILMSISAIPLSPGIKDDECMDVVETATPSTAGRKNKKLMKTLRDLLADIEASEEPAAKVRLIYAAVIYILTSRGIKIRRSDTAEEIMKKAAEIQGISGSMQAVTGIYNEVRYGDVVPGIVYISAAAAALDNVANAAGRPRS